MNKTDDKILGELQQGNGICLSIPMDTLNSEKCKELIG